MKSESDVITNYTIQPLIVEERIKLATHRAIWGSGDGRPCVTTDSWFLSRSQASHTHPKKRGPKKSKGERRSQTGKSIKEMIRPGSRVSTSACSPSECGAALEKRVKFFRERKWATEGLQTGVCGSVQKRQRL